MVIDVLEQILAFIWCSSVVISNKSFEGMVVARKTHIEHASFMIKLNWKKNNINNINKFQFPMNKKFSVHSQCENYRPCRSNATRIRIKKQEYATMISVIAAIATFCRQVSAKTETVRGINGDIYIYTYACVCVCTYVYETIKKLDMLLYERMLMPKQFPFWERMLREETKSVTIMIKNWRESIHSWDNIKNKNNNDNEKRWVCITLCMDILYHASKWLRAVYLDDNYYYCYDCDYL